MSKKPIVVVSSDNHLQVCAWKKYPDICFDSFVSFEEIYKFSEEINLPVILAGDVIDNKYPDSATLFCLSSVLNKSKNNTYFIQGQHEFSNPAWLSLFGYKNIHVDSKIFNVKGSDINFYGLDFRRKEYLLPELEAMSDTTDVFVAHQSWAERCVKVTSSEASLSDIRKCNFVITGDFHCHKITDIKRADLCDLKVLSPGSTAMQSIDEDPDKYFFVLFDDLSFESVKIKNCRKFVYINIKHKFDLNNFIKSDLLDRTISDSEVLDNRIKKPVFVFYIFADIPGVELILRDFIKDKAFCIVKDRNVVFESHFSSGDKVSFFIEDCLAKVVNKADPVHSSALRLLKAPDPLVELKKIYDEFLKNEKEFL